MEGAVSVTDPLALSALSASALTAAFKFLFDRAGTFLDRWADRRVAAKPSDGECDSMPAEEFAERLSDLRESTAALAVYQRHSLPITPDDALLVQAMEIVRTQLKMITGDRLPIDDPSAVGVVVRQTVRRAEGSTVGIDAKAVEHGSNASVEQEVGVVEQTGEVVGMRIRGPLK